MFLPVFLIKRNKKSDFHQHPNVGHIGSAINQLSSQNVKLHELNGYKQTVVVPLALFSNELWTFALFKVSQG